MCRYPVSGMGSIEFHFHLLETRQEQAYIVVPHTSDGLFHAKGHVVR